MMIPRQIVEKSRVLNHEYQGRFDKINAGQNVACLGIRCQDAYPFFE